MTDTDLQKHVLAEINWDPRVEAGHIGVAVQEGVATLSGHVANYVERHAAERAAERVKGVVVVANELEVWLPDEITDTDEMIAHRAVHVLGWDTSLGPQNIKVVVDHGWVELGGTVDWGFQREAAERTVHRITGVKGVRNLIALRRRPAADTIREQIVAAIRRHAELEAASISVMAEGGKVVLSGTVNSLVERRLAEQAAWSAPGVTAVLDQLQVR